MKTGVYRAVVHAKVQRRLEHKKSGASTPLVGHVLRVRNFDSFASRQAVYLRIRTSEYTHIIINIHMHIYMHNNNNTLNGTCRFLRLNTLLVYNGVHHTQQFPQNNLGKHTLADSSRFSIYSNILRALEASILLESS